MMARGSVPPRDEHRGKLPLGITSDDCGTSPIANIGHRQQFDELLVKELSRDVFENVAAERRHSGGDPTPLSERKIAVQISGTQLTAAISEAPQHPGLLRDDEGYRD
jgi:hypothetical protein